MRVTLEFPGSAAKNERREKRPEMGELRDGTLSWFLWQGSSELKQGEVDVTNHYSHCCSFLGRGKVHFMENCPANAPLHSACGLELAAPAKESQECP